MRTLKLRTARGLEIEGRAVHAMRLRNVRLSELKLRLCRSVGRVWLITASTTSTASA